MEKGLKHFITSNIDSAHRWQKFKYQVFPSIFEMKRVDEFTPFFNTPFFNLLTESQKGAFYRAFIQFNAEALILLELVLYEGVRSLIAKTNNVALIEASRKIMAEEKDHTKAFVRFLKKDCPGFAQRSYLLRNNRIFKNSFLWLARKNPVALALPAAKVEAYTVFYGKALKEAFAHQANSWSQLNVLHLLDESLHIGYEFDMYEIELSKVHGFCRALALICTFICIFYLQVCFLIGCSRMVRQILGSKSFLKTSRWTLRLGGWILQEFGPYQQTRNFLKTQFQARAPLYGGLFGFMYK